jgi:hypothetical protein
MQRLTVALVEVCRVDLTIHFGNCHCGAVFLISNLQDYNRIDDAGFHPHNPASSSISQVDRRKTAIETT